MKPIKAKVAELLTILKKNRETHEEIFIAAQKIYRSEVIRKLDQALQSAKDGKEFPSYIQIPAPENHTKDYDRVIRMLELSVDDVVELAENEVEVYVMDKWSWSHQWAASNMQYLNDDTVKYAITGSASVSTSFSSGETNYQSLFGGTSLQHMQNKLNSYL